MFKSSDDSTTTTTTTTTMEHADTTTTTTTPPTTTNVAEFQPNISIRTDADRERDLIINVGFLIMMSVIMLAKIATVSMDHWRGWSPAEIFLRIPLDNWDGYMSFLEDHPVVTKALTSFSVYMLGDWTAQVSH